MAEFFYMGGYAFYVWGSYLVVAIALIWSFVTPRSAERRIKKSLKTRLSAITKQTQ